LACVDVLADVTIIYRGCVISHGLWHSTSVLRCVWALPPAAGWW